MSVILGITLRSPTNIPASSGDSRSAGPERHCSRSGAFQRRRLTRWKPTRTAVCYDVFSRARKSSARAQESFSVRLPARALGHAEWTGRGGSGRATWTPMKPVNISAKS